MFAFLHPTPLVQPLTHNRRSTCRLSPVHARCQPRATLEAPPAATVDWPDAATLSQSAARPDAELDINQVMALLPHRYPFLLVDRVLRLEAGKRAIGIKAVTVNEPFFPGHFPGRPIMPGVLQIEALAQLSGIVLIQEHKDEVEDFFFGGVDGVRWRKPVVPGDTLTMQVTCKSFKKRFGIAKFEAAAYVDGQLAVEAQLTLAMVMKK